MEGVREVILILGVALFEQWKTALVKRFDSETVPMGHGEAHAGE